MIGENLAVAIISRCPGAPVIRVAPGSDGAIGFEHSKCAKVAHFTHRGNCTRKPIDPVVGAGRRNIFSTEDRLGAIEARGDVISTALPQNSQHILVGIDLSIAQGRQRDGGRVAIGSKGNCERVVRAKSGWRGVIGGRQGRALQNQVHRQLFAGVTGAGEREDGGRVVGLAALLGGIDRNLRRLIVSGVNDSRRSSTERSARATN